MQCERKPLTRHELPVNGLVEHASTNGSLPLSGHHINTTIQEGQELQTFMLGRPAPLPSPTNASQPTSPAVLSDEQFESILSSDHLQFKLNPPSLGVSSLSMDYVYEIATRLLFLTIDWARSIQAFRRLDNTDQLILLQSTWSDIFMLGVAQCANSFPLSPLLSLAAVHMKNNEGIEDQKRPNMLEKIMSVKDLLFSVEKLELDCVEFALLKAIVLLNSGKYY